MNFASVRVLSIKNLLRPPLLLLLY